ncbi:MAG: hypothetical protein H2056_03400 [Sphingopyxis sp.]|nr:hypothetical protein [Sphingopyxis sp.]
MTESIANQLELLTGVTQLYDAGRHIHGLDIAARLSVIVEWLNSQEGGVFIKDRGITFKSYALPRGPRADKEGYHALAIVNVSMRAPGYDFKASFTPLFLSEGSPLSKDYRPYPFVRMNLGQWKRQAVLASAKGKGATLNREKLIEQMRNKVGGSHPASDPSQIYAEVADEMGLGLYAVYGMAEQRQTLPFTPTAPFATVRQIAFEMVASLKPFIG